MKILVTDGSERAALAIVRSLGRAGHQVVVAAHRSTSLAAASRYAAASVGVGDPLAGPVAYVDAVRAVITGQAIDLVIPVSEAALLCLLPERERLGAAVPFVDVDRFRVISDKAAVAEAARKAGIAVPVQHVCSDRDGLAALAGDAAVRFPLVLKPARSVVEQRGGARRKLGVFHAAGRHDLEQAAAAMPAEAYPILAQQRIVGPGVGVFILMWEGSVRASFSHRRIREKPPAGGVSVYRESIAMDPELLERSVELLRGFGWQGVAMVEYKRDEQSGVPFVMEINGRFWGSLQLAIDAGVDFPRLLVDAAVGLGTQGPEAYGVGVRVRWFMGDVDHLLARLRRSPVQLALPPGSPGRARAVLDFLRAFGPGSRNEILQLRDPMPAWREGLDWLRDVVVRSGKAQPSTETPSPARMRSIS